MKMSPGKNGIHQQRVQIKLLRVDGYSFSVIAQQLNISKTA